MNGSRLHARRPSVRSAAGTVRLPLIQAGARAGWGATTRLFGLCLALAIVGAMLVHAVEYHLGLGAGGHRLASIQFMLAHCPVRGGLLVVGLSTVVTLLALWREMRLLLRQRRDLTLLARRSNPVETLPAPRTPLYLKRLVALFLPLLAAQAGAYALLGHLWPMTFAMRMHGVLVDMAVPGAVPLWPLQIGVATLLASLAWGMERRFGALHAVIGAACRMLARLLSAVRNVPLPAYSPAAHPAGYGVPGAFPRPPPL
jgi:hypothetical protein